VLNLLLAGQNNEKSAGCMFTTFKKFSRSIAFPEKPEEKGPKNGRILLKWILIKSVGRSWSGLIWHRARTINGLL
jgi:hypothetical protein